jgi:hypothetical protein
MPPAKPPFQTTASSLADIQKILGSSGKPKKEVIINGVTFCEVNLSCIYSVSAHHHTTNGSLVDHGANGGVAGDDIHIVHHTLHMVNIQGIDNHQVPDIPIVTAAGVVTSQKGPIIAILHQYAYIGHGKSIHSCGQMEWYKNDVNDHSIKVNGGLQCIKTLDGYVHPINIHHGLPYVKMRPYTDVEWETLPHVIWTGDTDWDPTVLDHTLDDDEAWYDAVKDLEDDPSTNLFEEYGQYHN